jgi:hypothetical protein
MATDGRAAAVPPAAAAHSGSAQPATLRAAVAGLLGFAATEETVLLAGAAIDADEGNAACWAAVPAIAHNSEFKEQQVRRLAAVRERTTPPEFPQIDHRSPAVYRGYADRDGQAVAAASWTISGALLAGALAASDEDLLDPSRHPWLAGRQLWLQIVVRGFWHPIGHVGEYYLRHHRPERAVALHEHAVAAARYHAAPDAALGMACYGLACAQAVTGRHDEALETLAEAVSRNPDLQAPARRDEDLVPLRPDRRFSRLLT